MDYWARPGLDRQQALLFYPTLDQAIGEGHPVRLLEEILQGLDWSAWTLHYDGRHGQPPIPPWAMAGVILYGLMRRIRSSRQLEYACVNNIDFMWLAEGRTIDHDTICKFRTRFGKELKALFRQVNRVALGMGLIRLLEVAIDGTRVKANASRHRTWTAKKVEAVLAELESKFGALLEEATAADRGDDMIRGEGRSSLSPELRDATQRQAKLREVLQQLHESDTAREKRGTDPEKKPAQLPQADRDSCLMPNKEGGHAPNYNPVVATDGQAGLIADCDVVNVPDEHETLPACVERIEEAFGQKPEKALADAKFATAANLQGMEASQVDLYTPVEAASPQEGNPAKRDDPRQAVAEADWARLPRNHQKKLGKCCFLYDAAADLYYCPLGKPLRYEETKKVERSSGVAALRVYRCHDCVRCPLAGECLDPRGKRGRTISRDGAEPLRDRMAAKLRTETGRATYNRRMHIVETTFAYIKRVLGVRQFLLRGLEKVRIEWTWGCTAYNLGKLIRIMAQLRAEAAAVAMQTGS